jgi:hypothetical protein
LTATQGWEAGKKGGVAMRHHRKEKAFGGKQTAKMFHVKHLRRPFAVKDFIPFG